MKGLSIGMSYFFSVVFSNFFKAFSFSLSLFLLVLT